MSSTTLTTSLIVRLVDRVTGPIKRVIKGVGDVEKTGKRAAKSFELASNMKHSADAVKGFGTSVLSAIKGPVDKFKDFQEQMSSVKASTFDLTKTLDASQVRLMDAAMVDLAATARRLGSDTKYSASEAAAGMDILAKNFSGEDLQKAQDIMKAMPGILNTAAATRESIENAADIQTAAMNQFGLGAADMGRIGDVLVKTANGTATGLLDLGEALKYSGVTAAKANIDLETTLGMIGALGNAGKRGSVAGTGLASVLGNFQSGMKKQKGALAALGINIKDKQGNLRPIIELLAEAERAADKKFGKGKGGVRRDRWMQGLVGMGGDKEALAILMKQAGTGELQALVEMNKKSAGTAAQVAAEMNRNAAGASKELDSAFEELQLTVGEKVIPEFTELLKWSKELIITVTTWAKENPTLVRSLGLLLGVLGSLGLVVAPIISGVSALITIWGGLTWAWALAVKGAKLLTAEMHIMKLGVVGSMKAIKTAIASNPVGALLTAALLIYEYWEPISEFFSGLWDSVTAGFKVAIAWIVDKLEWAGDQVRQIKDTLLMQETYDSARAAAQQGQLAGMSPEQLRQLQALGGGIGALAGDTLKQQRELSASAGKISAHIGPVGGWIGAATGAPAANGAPLIREGEEPSSSKFDGELKITVNGQGEVVQQKLETKGDPGFRVRTGTGRQR